jgi:hypothetical protein
VAASEGQESERIAGGRLIRDAQSEAGSVKVTIQVCDQWSHFILSSDLQTVSEFSVCKGQDEDFVRTNDIRLDQTSTLDMNIITATNVNKISDQNENVCMSKDQLLARIISLWPESLQQPAGHLLIEAVVRMSLSPSHH